MTSARPASVLLSAARAPSNRQQCQLCTHLYYRPRPTAASSAIAAKSASSAQSRSFHDSPVRTQRHKPKHTNLTHEQLQKLTAQNAASFQSYTEAEKAHLRKRYTPAQMAAIEAAEAAIPAEDLAAQAKVRRDPLMFTYLDDFSRIEPTIDKKIEKLRGEGSDYEKVTDFAEVPSAVDMFGQIEDAVVEAESRGSWNTEENPIEMDEETGEFTDGEITFEQDKHAHILRSLLKDPEYDAALESAASDAAAKTEGEPEAARKLAIESATKAAKDKFYNLRLAELNNTQPPPFSRFSHPLEAQIDAILAPALEHADVAPDIPKLQDPSVRWTSEAEDAGDSGIDEDAIVAYQRVAKAMGMPVDQLRKYRVKTLVQRRVVNQTRLGKIASVYYLCVAGNERGLLGIGEGKAAEPDEALRVAQLNAIRSMVPILRYENRTIYGEVHGKVGAVEVRLSARQPGFGVRCSEKIFEIARCAGLSDLQAKVTRKARNPMNVAKAVWQALRSQRDPEEVARGRGRKLVDVRKVYYSGLV